MNLLTRLQNVHQKKSRILIGLMSGMSMDGIDLALVKCTGAFPDFDVELLDSDYKPYSAALRARLQAGRTAVVGEIALLNIDVAEAFSACLNEFLLKRGIDKSTIDAIGSHGQTVFHQTSQASEPRTTLQLGAPSLIAERTGLITIGNFRLRDIAVGGQGAPCVAFADYVLHRNEGPVLLINFGSIANVTLIDGAFENIFAFDAGPANMPSDDFVARNDATRKMDVDGKLAAQGTIIKPLLDELLALSFFQTPPPRAAGYAEFGPVILGRVFEMYRHFPVSDLLRTAVEFSARTLARSIELYVLPRCPHLRIAKVSGGGVYNQTLMTRVRDLLPWLNIERLDRKFADAKEAMAFAILAHTTLNGEPGNVMGATGAKKAVVLGEIAV